MKRLDGVLPRGCSNQWQIKCQNQESANKNSLWERADVRFGATGKKRWHDGQSSSSLGTEGATTHQARRARRVQFPRAHDRSLEWCTLNQYRLCRSSKATTRMSNPYLWLQGTQTVQGMSRTRLWAARLPLQSSQVQQFPKDENRQKLCKKKCLCFHRPGHHISGNLWNIDIEDRSRKPGPMASFLRHVNSMQSPNNPTYVDTRMYPVMDVLDLRREMTLENVAAHQRYLEKLQFEMKNTLRSWSNSIQDQIMGEIQKLGPMREKCSTCLCTPACHYKNLHLLSNSVGRLSPKTSLSEWLFSEVLVKDSVVSLVE